MKKNPEQTDRTRKQIVDAFWELYEENPIERITVKEIVAKADCNRSTFYVYFNNVYEVLDFIETKLLDRIEENLKNAPKNPSYEEVLRQQVLQFEDEGKYLSVLLSENGDPSFSKRFREEFEARFKDETRSTLNEMQATYVSEFALGGVSRIMTKWLKNKEDLPFDELMYILHVFKETEIALLEGDIEFWQGSK